MGGALCYLRAFMGKQGFSRVHGELRKPRVSRPGILLCEKLCVRDSASAGELQPSIWWLRGFLSHRLLRTGMSLSTVPHSGTKPSSVRCSGCGQMDPGGQAVTVQCEDQPTSLQHCINPSSTFMLGLHSCPQCRPLMTTTVSSTPGPFS